MPVPPWASYGEGGRRAVGSVSTCCFTIYPPKASPSALVATGRVQAPPKDNRRRQKEQQQRINTVLEEALEECNDEEEAASANSSSSTAAMSVVVPPVFGSYPYDNHPASAADVPSVLLRCKRAEEQQEVLLLAAASAISAAMRQQLQTICRIVRTHAAVGSLELLQHRSSSNSSKCGELCEFLPVVIMLVGADVEDHRLAVRMLQLQLQQEAKCCCGGRQSSRSSRSSKDDLFLKQVVLRASSCTNMQAALRAVYGQIKASSCCSSCIGRSSSSSKSKEGDTVYAAVPEEIAADAAAAAAWGERASFCAHQQQQQLLLQCLEGGGDDSTTTTGAAHVSGDDEDGNSLGHDISRRIGQLWRKQLQQHHRGFCCSWRRMGEGAAIRTRSQQQQRAVAGAGSEDSSSDSSLSGTSSDEESLSVAQRGHSSGSNSSSNSTSALVIILEELEAFTPRMLSQLLLLLALLRTKLGIPVVVLASAAASAVAVQQLLEPATLRLLQIDAAVLLRPSAVHDALLQLLLCCPASTPFVLPAAAIEELQELFLDQGTSVLQLLRVLRMLLYKYFAEHPFSFLSIDARALVPSSTINDKEEAPETAPSADSAAASFDLETLERRLALLAAAVLTPQQEQGLLLQLKKFPLLHAELVAAAREKLEPSCCKSWRLEQQQQQQQNQQQQPAAKEGCTKTPICGTIARASARLQQWWGCQALAEAADAKQSAAVRSRALLQMLPAAALQLMERRVAASIAMRLLVVLQQHVLQQRQAFALTAEEKAAATAANSMGSSSTLPAVGLMLQILESGRAQGYHDYLLQGQLTCAAAAPRIVSLICEEMRRVAGACSRIGGLVTTLVSEALSAAATTGRVAAVPHALLLALQQFSRQSRREWALVMQLERHQQQKQESAEGSKATDLFRMMNKLIELLEQTCQQQQQQRSPGARGAFVSGLARRASAAASFGGNMNNTSSNDTNSGLCGRFHSWARDCLLHFLLPLPQWHPVGCELTVWSLSYAAAEQPQYLAAVLAVPRAPAHRAEAAASDALARLQPLKPIEVLQQLACLSSCTLEYHQQAARAAAPGRAMGKDTRIFTDDTGLLYRRIAFGSRRIALWALFCSFCNDLIDSYIQQGPHLRDQQQQQANKQQETYGTAKRKQRARKQNTTNDVEPDGESSPARIAAEMKVLQELQVEAEAGSAERHTNSPPLLRHLFLRFGVALCALEHLGLVRLPSAATSADDLLLHAADTEGAAAGEETAASDAGAESNCSSEEESAINTQKQQQSAAAEVPTKGRKKRSSRTARAPSDALQLQLQGLYLTRCFFGSVYVPELQEAQMPGNQNSSSTVRQLRNSSA